MNTLLHEWISGCYKHMIYWRMHGWKTERWFNDSWQTGIIEWTNRKIHENQHHQIFMVLNITTGTQGFLNPINQTITINPMLLFDWLDSWTSTTSNKSNSSNKSNACLGWHYIGLSSFFKENADTTMLFVSCSRKMLTLQCFLVVFGGST